MNIKNVLAILIFLILHFSLFSQNSKGILWQRVLGGQGSETPIMTSMTNDSGYILLSFTDTNSVAQTGSHGSTDLWVVKLNSIGEIEWQRALGGSSSEVPSAVFVNSDSTYTVVGYTSSNNFDVSGNHQPTIPAEDVWVVKLSKAGIILWQHCYGGSSNEEVRSCIKNSSGNIVIAAITSSTDGDVTGYHSGVSYDIWVLEINNSNGNLVSQRAYGGAYLDAPRSIIQQSDGKYVVSGYTQSNDGNVSGNHTTNNGSDTWVLKLNTITSLEWQKCLGSPLFNDEIGYKVSESDNRSLIVLSESFGNGGDVTGNHGNRDIWMIKLDENSNIIWQRNLGGSSSDGATSFFENPNGSIIVLGSTSSNNGDVSGYHSGTVLTEDLWVVKLSSNGVLLWQKTYGGSQNESFSFGKPSIFKEPDDGYILIGVTNSADGDVIGQHPPNNYPTDTSSDIWMLKISDVNGAIQWQRCLGGSFNERVGWAQRISDAEFLITSSSYSSDGDVTGPRMSNSFSLDSWIVKLGYVNSIKGSVFIDSNSNGIKDAGELFYSKVLVKSVKPGYSRIQRPVNGAFLNDVDTGSYVTTLSLDYPYYTVLPSQKNSVFANYSIIDSFGFALSPIPNKKDLMIGIISQFRSKPGFNARYKVFYENVGNVSLPGNVKFIKDTRTTFVSSIPSPNSIVADTITYNFSNLNPLDASSIEIVLSVSAPPVVNINDTLKYSAIIFPQTGDETILNNNDTLIESAVGSIDPNDKTESHGAFITNAKINNGEQLSYLIRFQNTGTDTAYNIVIRDTLDIKLQREKLQMINSSHPCSLELTDGKYLSWHFNNIKLVDSAHNEPASHGYIYFRINPQTNLIPGDTIKNSASIYFDFNPPVKTNVVNIVVKNPSIVVTGLNNPVPPDDWEVVAYPNPTNGILNIAIRGKIYGDIGLKIRDQLGRNVVQQSLGKKSTPVLQSQINLANLQAGIYYLTISSPKNSKTLTIKIH